MIWSQRDVSVLQDEKNVIAGIFVNGQTIFAR